MSAQPKEKQTDSTGQSSSKSYFNAAACVVCGFLLFGCKSIDKIPDDLLRAARGSLRHGQLSKVEEYSERGLQAAQKSDNQSLLWKFRLIRCEAWLQEHRAAEILNELSKPIPRGVASRLLEARKKMLEGEALLSQGRESESGAALASAYQLAISSGDQETIADVEVGLGALFLRQSEWNKAERVLDSALKRAESAGLPYEAAGALVNLGMSRVDRHRYDEAIGYFNRAAKLATSESATLYNVAQANLATCFNNLGESERAIEIEQRSVIQHERSGAKLYLQSALGETGHAFQQIGNGEKATMYLERALDVAKEIGSNRNAAVWAGNLSIAYSDRGDWDKAERFNNEAIRIKKAAGISTLVYNKMNSARVAAGRGNQVEGEHLYRESLAQTEDPAVLWEAHGELGRLAAAQGKQQEALREFEAAVNLVEQRRSELLATEYKLPFLSRLIRLYQWYVEALASQGSFGRALAVADSSRAQTLAQRFDAAPERQLSEQAFTRIANASGGKILTYWLGPRESHVWLITPDGVKHVTLAPEAEIIKLVDDYRIAVEVRQADPLRTRIVSGERLYKLLVEPVRQWIPSGSRVIIVPDGVLSGLNFETLPVPGGKPHYWIEEVTIAIAPSIKLLGHSRVQSKSGTGLLVIGDPEVDSSFPPLPQAASEIDLVAERCREDLCIVKRKSQATPAAYQEANPNRFDKIHFTAHAIANRGNPLDSAIILSGGKLYARDILTIPLRAALVTISSCRGAGSRLYSGEGLVGFAWAFLRAGARNVIAGLWDVNDQSTADLMAVMYRELASESTPAEALRQAKLTLIRSTSNFRKPYYWGAFQVYTIDSIRRTPHTSRL